MSVSYDDPRVWGNIHEELKDGLLIRMAGSLECSICSEVMHVPFLAVCGHSFCYGCLDSWFETKVNCPTCRKDMAEPPVLNIQLREVSKSLTDMVIDTLEDAKYKEELIAARQQVIDEFEQATKSRSLFRDAFDSAQTLVDRSDGVPRCGNCHWEAHGSECLHCGARFRTPRGDSYYDSEDGDAYNEDREEVEMYGIDAANYDSEDSFVDNRDVHEINNDGYESDGLLSSGGEQSGVESWEGFRRDSEMYRGENNEASLFREPVQVELSSESDHDNRAHYVDDQASESDYEDTYGVNESRQTGYDDDMENAVEELHDQDVHDYSTRYEPDFEEGSDSDWGTSVAMGRRSAYIVDSDSE
ncbi:hypothetical protein OXX59_008086 [Metschnikowia pulcherrima]